jgi:hypothetical protein
MSARAIASSWFVCFVALASPLSAGAAEAECPKSEVKPALTHAEKLLDGDQTSDEARGAAAACLRKVLLEGKDDASAERAGELLDGLYDQLGDQARVDLAKWLRNHADQLGGRFPARVGGRIAGRFAELEGARSEDELLLGRREANSLYEGISSRLFEASIAEEWEEKTEDDDEAPPVVAVWPIKNETRRSVGGALSALLSRLETDLVNKSAADVVDLANQPALLEQLRAQQSDESASSGSENETDKVGADYLVTGTMYALERPDTETPTVEYVLVAQVIETESGNIVFQTDARVETTYAGE